jgi:Ca-activated chloride channel homolog
MKKFVFLALLVCFTAAQVQTSFAQSRPRRVGSKPPAQTQQTQQPSQTQPDDSADQSDPAARPSRPPVLGGANRDPNEQKPAATSSQTSGPEEVGEGDVVRVNTTLVSLPVSVMDRDGKYIPNLRKEDFRVWEDGVEQQVAYFASVEKPFTVALMIDTSGSTQEKLRDIQDAAQTFVEQLRPDDRVTVITFDDKIRQLVPPTNDRYAIRGAIDQVRPGSGTRLYDAVHQVIDQYLSRVEGRKAVVLFTDGVDTTSKHSTYESTVRDAEELDALIYPVEYDTFEDMGGWGGGYPRGGGYPGGRRSGGGGGIGGILGSIILGGGYPGGGYPGGGYPRGGGGYPRGGAGTSREEYERADQYLNDLARVSGARLYKADGQNLSYSFQQIAEELRRQYSIGYYPKKPPQQGERRSIKVRTNKPELVVKSRDSYVFQQGANTAQQAQQNQQGQAKPPVLKKELSGTF